jgi:hypothetical protein
MVDNNLVKKQPKHSIAKQKDKIIGIVTATITITNHIDEVLGERGFIPAEQIRCITIDNVLVDTGATRLCKPSRYYRSVSFYQSATAGSTNIIADRALLKRGAPFLLSRA